MRHSSKRPSSRTLFAVLALLAPSAASAQIATREPGLQEEQRVTAVDVLVELDAGVPGGRDRVRSLAKGLGPGDFEIRIEGDPRPVVGYFDPRAERPDRSERSDELWSIVLYFDLDLAQRDTVRWAAAELAELVPDLVELGEVELMITGDGELRGLAPTRDAELLVGELAGLAISPGGLHGLIELRAEVLDALQEEPGALEEPGVVRALAEQEVALVERRLDELLLHLTEREVATAKRALFWVADGFDLEPEAFYRAQGVEVERLPIYLKERTAKLSVTLASYGWVAFSLSPPPADAGIVPGFRIGKWLFGPAEGGRYFLRLTREERRDPDRAKGHYQLGRAHLAAGEAKEAERAFERALYHYAGDPRTSREQAASKAGLGRALEAQGAVAEARQAFRHAVELDPSLAAELPQARPRLLEPLAFQQVLASSTAGRVVQDNVDLAEAIDSMSRRVRLTYQISGVPQGEVRKLEVLLAGSDLELRYPSWTRSGTPSGVAAARARRLAAGELEGGGLRVRAELSATAGSGPVVVVEVDPESLGASGGLSYPVMLRVTAATGRADGLQDVHYRRFDVGREDGEPQWRFRLPVDKAGDAPAGEDGIAVVVEDLDSGRWGGTLID